MTIYIAYGDDGRVGAYTIYSQYANGMTAVEAPEGFDPETSNPTDYVYSDGVMTYDPLPEPPEPPDPVAIATEAKEMARTAQATAEGASADIADYLDALLGLDETDETEATDAE